MENDKVLKVLSLDDSDSTTIVNSINHVTVTEAAMATTFVALVVAAAVIVPSIVNEDVSVNLNVIFIGDSFSYSIEIENPVEEEIYYAIVLEDDKLIHQEVIQDARQSETLTGLAPDKEHTLEVRTGYPPMYVVASLLVPEASIWGEWDHIRAGYTTINYGVIIHGDADDLTLYLYEPVTKSIVYHTDLTEGLNSDVIRGLWSSHTYLLMVAYLDEVIMSYEVTTDDPHVSWDYISVKDNTVSYEVTVSENDSMNISLYDPSRSSLVYSRDLSFGVNSDIITGLEYGHAYQITVTSGGTILLSESVKTEVPPITVSLGYLAVDEKNINYEVTVTGDSYVATLKLFDSNGGAAVFTKDLSPGANAGTIEAEYGHTYQFTVSSVKETYINEKLTTLAEPTKVTVNYLGPKENTIEYDVTVTGNREVATLYLYEFNGVSPKYSIALSVGANVGAIDNLEFDHIYVVKISSPSQTYLSKKVTTEMKPTSVSLGHLTVTGNSIDYEVSMTGGREAASVYLYDTVGDTVVYSKSLSLGTNADTITGLAYDHAYRFEATSSIAVYISQSVTTEQEPTTVTLGHLTPVANTIDYEVTVAGASETVTLYLYYSVGGSLISSTVLSVGSNSDVISGLEYGHAYQFVVSSTQKTFINESVTTQANPTSVTLDHLTPVANTIDYEVTVAGASETVTLYLYDSVGGAEMFSTDLSVGDNEYVIEDLEYNHTYRFVVASSGTTYLDTNVTTEERVIKDYLTVDGNMIEYGLTVYGSEDASILIYLDNEVIVELPLPEGYSTGIYARTSDDDPLAWGTTYVVNVLVDEVEYPLGSVDTDDAITPDYLSPSGNTIEYGFTINRPGEATMIILKGGDQVGSKSLVAGDNYGTYGNGGDDEPLEWGVTYSVVVAIDDDEYPLGTVKTDDAITPDYLSPSGNTIEYGFTINRPGDASMIILKGGDQVGSKSLVAGENYGTYGNSGDDEPLEWGVTYTVVVAIDDDEYPLGTVKTDDAITPNYLNPSGNTIEYGFTINRPGEATMIILKGSDQVGSKSLVAGDNYGTYGNGGDDEPLEWGVTYSVVVAIDDDEYPLGTVKTDDAVTLDYLRSNYNSIEYGFSVDRPDYAAMYIVIGYESIAEIPLQTGDNYGTYGLGPDDEPLEWGKTYTVIVAIIEDEYTLGTVNIVERYSVEYIRSSGSDIEYSITINDSLPASVLFMPAGYLDDIDDISLVRGENKGKYQDSDWGETYDVTIFIGDDSYIQPQVEIPPAASIVSAIGGTDYITYSIKVNADDAAVLKLYYKSGDVRVGDPITTVTLSKGTNNDSITGLESAAIVYDLAVEIGGTEYVSEEVATSV